MVITVRARVALFLGIGLCGLTTLYIFRDKYTSDGNTSGESNSLMLSSLVDSTQTEELNSLDKLIVVAHYHESLDWLENLSVPYRVIDKDNPENPDNMYSNNHTESTSYLYFMIKYYNHLPQKMAFVHGHGDQAVVSDDIRGPVRSSPHYDPGSLMNIDFWVTRAYSPINVGDYDLTVNTMHECEGGQLFWFGPAVSRPLPKQSSNDRPEKVAFDSGYYDLWRFLELPIVKGGLGMTLPHFVTYKCCSTFVVDRQDIHRIPREILIRLFLFLEKGSYKSAGNAMEHVWGLLFNVAHWKV